MLTTCAYSTLDRSAAALVTAGDRPVTRKQVVVAVPTWKLLLFLAAIGYSPPRSWREIEIVWKCVGSLDLRIPCLLPPLSLTSHFNNPALAPLNTPAYNIVDESKPWRLPASTSAADLRSMGFLVRSLFAPLACVLKKRETHSVHHTAYQISFCTTTRPLSCIFDTTIHHHWTATTARMTSLRSSKLSRIVHTL